MEEAPKDRWAVVSNEIPVSGGLLTKKRNKKEVKHECKTPINWFFSRFGRGSQFICDCGQVWIYKDVVASDFCAWHRWYHKDNV